MTDATTSTSTSTNDTTTTDTSASSQSGASGDESYGQPALLSDSPKTAWDVVKDIDWGDQLDALKASAESHKATAEPIGAGTSSTSSTEA